jgi:hypothetical protein
MQTKTKGVTVDTHHMIEGTSSPDHDLVNKMWHLWVGRAAKTKVNGVPVKSQIWAGKIPGTRHWALFAEKRDDGKK